MNDILGAIAAYKRLAIRLIVTRDLLLPVGSRASEGRPGNCSLRGKPVFKSLVSKSFLTLTQQKLSASIADLEILEDLERGNGVDVQRRR